ncbi:restriction endonuclease subunit S, partial [Planktomarina temperata]|nr:restriction endonuclease subunit S [Planktomarina temperata]
SLVPEYKHAVGQRVITISPKRTIFSSIFLCYFLQGAMFQKQIIDASTGSTVTGVKQSTLRNALTLVPPLDEQEEISNIIKSIDGKMKWVTAKLSQTQSLKKSLMQDLLTGKVRVQVN